jgi:hypothetical protein
MAGWESFNATGAEERREGSPRVSWVWVEKQVPLHPSLLAGVQGNDRKATKATAGFATSFELRVSSCELKADSLRE